jgi:hypothetical protein
MSEKHPDSRINDPCLRFWLQRKKWKVCPPYAEWDYWYIIKGDTGGIVPLNVDLLINDYFADPLSLDEVAIKQRQGAISQQNNA